MVCHSAHRSGQVVDNTGDDAALSGDDFQVVDQLLEGVSGGVGEFVQFGVDANSLKIHLKRCS